MSSNCFQMWFLLVLLISLGGMFGFEMESSENETSSEDPVIFVNTTGPLAVISIKVPVANEQVDEDGQLCFCTKELAPVCDVLGKEYSNECVLNCFTRIRPGIVLGCRHRCPC